MCDKLSPSCCVANTTASKTSCIANGGTPSADPCNILNPTATPSSCAATKVASNVIQSSWYQSLPQWAIVTLTLLMLVFGILGAMLYLKVQTGGSFVGGRRGFNLFGNLKKLKW